MNKTFGVIGGDRRQAELAGLLEADGRTVRTYGLGARRSGGETSLRRAAACDVAILPLPLCQGDGVLNCQESPVPTLDLFQSLRPEQLILAGQIKPKQLREAELCGLKLEDYFLREELTVANAAATAEAAIQVAMEQPDPFGNGLPGGGLRPDRKTAQQPAAWVGGPGNGYCTKTGGSGLDPGIRLEGTGDKMPEWISGILWRSVQYGPLPRPG